MEIAIPVAEQNKRIRNSKEESCMSDKPKSYRDAFFSDRKFSCNKWDHYFEIYDNLLASKYASAPVNYLEIGVQNGGSLEIACMLFGEDSKIYGIDIDPRCKQMEHAGIAEKIFIGSQVDNDLLASVIDTAKEFDVIVDDGSHVQAHMLVTFLNLFPYLKEGGVYIIEDTHTNYFPTHQLSFYGIGLYDYFKALAERLNIDFMDPARASGRFKIPRDQRPPREIIDDIGRHIFSITFYDSVIAIVKKNKLEPFRLRR